MAPHVSSTILSLEGVTKTWGSNRAVDDVTITVQRGEVFGFLGPNGAGKSTTIRLILDILRPDSGNITILGDSNRLTRATHRKIGFLSGDMVLDSDLTGRQYLDLVNNIYGGSHSERLNSLADTLEAKLDVRIGMYSRGNRQKIGLIAALLHQPELLILDEPTSGFDPLVQEKFAMLLRQYVADGGTVFMSSHVLAEVQHLCDRVAFIRSGKIVATKTVAELLDTRAKRVAVEAAPAELKKFKTAAAKLSGLSLLSAKNSELTYTYSGPVRPLLELCAHHQLADITIREPELEEIFGEYYESAPVEATHA